MVGCRQGSFCTTELSDCKDIIIIWTNIDVDESLDENECLFCP